MRLLGAIFVFTALTGLSSVPGPNTLAIRNGRRLREEILYKVSCDMMEQKLARAYSTIVQECGQHEGMTATALTVWLTLQTRPCPIS